MPQLPLFGDAPQQHPLTAQSHSAGEASIARSSQVRSPRPKTARQQPLQAIPTPPAPTNKARHTRSIPPALIDPAPKFDPTVASNFDPLKNCRLCGAPIRIGGLDHSLCSADCGWVVDLQWLAWMEAHRRKRKEPEPQAATHTERGEREALDLFSYGLDRDTLETVGGAA